MKEKTDTNVPQVAPKNDAPVKAKPFLGTPRAKRNFNLKTKGK